MIPDIALTPMGTQSRETMEAAAATQDALAWKLPSEDRVVESMFGQADEAGDQVRKASDFALGYVRHEPIKTLLIAAAAGALLMVVVSMAVGSRKLARG